MTDEEIRAAVLRNLANIAPEIDPAQVRPDISFREQFDLDSMDLLNFIIALHHEFKVEIPERDYPKLLSLEGCVRYLQAVP